MMLMIFRENVVFEEKRMIYKKISYIDENLPNFDKQSPCVCGKDQFNLNEILLNM